MTYVSNDPSWWPTINFNIFDSHWAVAAGVVVVYDWVLTLGQEIELIWIRYVGIPFSASSLTTSVNLLETMPSVSLTDAGCAVTDYAMGSTNVALTAMLGVIMIARLYAMYQGSRKMLMFLVIIFLAVNIACGVITAISLNDTVIGNDQLLISIVWILNTVWEVLALCLSLWIAVKHFRELRRLGPSKGSTIRDCFRVLIQSHVLYFASSAHVSFVGVSCLQLAILSPTISNSDSIGVLILYGVLEILLIVQTFVLGPRLILSVREHNAKLVEYSDAETSMNSIVFQERVHVSTGSTV
ncbi:uncharacterized protein F5147DRAFT_654664 [Suillus discolor]|uniref:DUF6533 domain-containing protein n=1 Tax=Suillus discolor TaxID=1912936 RepID=A0A9P7F397_9AGAM|nr:uncharacterized protein F5147DRAFT_654664 [Suillus discolor]KAG2103761.1 hypothetical protein F5147DRAFT_654664 [Suillus discolor]